MSKKEKKLDKIEVKKEEFDYDKSNVDIKDITVNVYSNGETWRVEIIHKPTGIVVSENSQVGIHRNRVRAMMRLDEELAGKGWKKGG